MSALERYGWVCQLCGRAIDPKLKSRHPFGLTFDDIVPVSRGGARHRARNLWPADRACNQAKAARLLCEGTDVPRGTSEPENAALRASADELERQLSHVRSGVEGHLIRDVPSVSYFSSEPQVPLPKRE